MNANDTDRGKDENMDMPEPPPEATLIRVAREAIRVKVSAAASAAGMSPQRWSQVERGYQRRLGRYLRVSAPPATVAHMAHAVAVAPGQLEDAGRADAAEILRYILRRAPEEPVTPPPPPEKPLTPDEEHQVAAFLQAIRTSAAGTPGEVRRANGA